MISLHNYGKRYTNSFFIFFFVHTYTFLILLSFLLRIHAHKQISLLIIFILEKFGVNNTNDFNWRTPYAGNITNSDEYMNVMSFFLADSTATDCMY